MPLRRVEKKRLDAKFDACCQRRKIDTKIRREPNCQQIANRARLHFEKLTNRRVDAVPSERKYERHIETVGAKRKNASVAKKKRLNRQRYR